MRMFNVVFACVIFAASNIAKRNLIQNYAECACVCILDLRSVPLSYMPLRCLVVYCRFLSTLSRDEDVLTVPWDDVRVVDALRCYILCYVKPCMQASRLLLSGRRGWAA